jgi:hypothetical protein
MKCRMETIATANAATITTGSPERAPSASQTGETSRPARQRSRPLSERSIRRRLLQVRISIELGIDSLCRAEIPQAGGV